MLEIRFHGRGGTGTVLASRAYAKAVFYAGRHAITFPSFGPERRGAPVLAFARIDNKKIYNRTQIYEPDVVVCLDDAIMELIDIAQGLKKGGKGVLNSPNKPDGIKLSKSIEVGVVDATKIAKEVLESTITNSATLGALIRTIDTISFKHLEKGILSVFGERLGEKLAKKNVEAARIAFEETIFGTILGGRNYSQEKCWLPTVDELPIGTILSKSEVNSGQLIGPGSAITRKTGTWNHKKAKIDQEKCNKCLICVFHCPEGTIHREDDIIKIDHTYCKACGICIEECPENAISMVEIKDFSEITS